MAGILVQLLISWLLLRYIEGKSMSVLGLRPTWKRLQLLLLFFSVTAAVSAGDYLLKIVIAKQSWVLSDDLRAASILEGIWWNIKSVLFEELLFRGALFYILLRRLGVIWAITTSSAAFGIYHWFSFEIFGQLVPMAVVFLTTGLMGAVYAFGFARTTTLYTPIAMHLGWNIVRSVVFSDTAIGRQLLVEVKPRPVLQVSYFEYFILVYAALLTVLFLNYFLVRRQAVTDVPG